MAALHYRPEPEVISLFRERRLQAKQRLLILPVAQMPRGIRIGLFMEADVGATAVDQANPGPV